MTEKKMEIKFAPGCFDHFEGSQEELDDLIKQITDMFTSMTPEELMAQSQQVDIEDLIEEGDIEFVNAILGAESERKLQ